MDTREGFTALGQESSSWFAGRGSRVVTPKNFSWFLVWYGGAPKQREGPDGMSHDRSPPRTAAMATQRGNGDGGSSTAGSYITKFGACARGMWEAGDGGSVGSVCEFKQGGRNYPFRERSYFGGWVVIFYFALQTLVESSPRRGCVVCASVSQQQLPRQTTIVCM